MNPKIGIVMGSESDLPTMQEAQKILSQFHIESEIRILSAHRTPDLAAHYSKSAKEKGIQVIIAGAGMANHLAGAMAAHTILPVIGVPLDGSPIHGIDALFSTVQMPPGVPVACVAIGKAGAKNAAYLALQILALRDEKLAKSLLKERKKNEEAIQEKNKNIK